MADANSPLPTIVPLPEMSAERAAHVATLLQGAIDLHCHSGPAAMPRILGHTQAMQEAEEAGFEVLLYKDHCYPGMNHVAVLNDVFPEKRIRLYSGVALNNALGGINPYAVDHCVALGGQIVWMPTFSAKNHIEAYAAKSFPKTARPMMPPTPLSGVDANGRLTDDLLKCLDLIAAGNIILAGGHLPVNEQFLMFDEAKKRGVQKMMVNHPSYLIGCSDEDIRGLVSMGVYMEHSICMFVTSRAQQHKTADLLHLIDVAGAEMTILGSDLGLTQAPKPVDGYRMIVSDLIEAGASDAMIRQVVGGSARSLLAKGA